ncbi:MAG: DUF1461 domain-containing protein [Cocleimonas sp.]
MRRFYWSLFLLLSFIVTLPVSWWVLTKVDFFYPTLHDVINIDEHIKKYGPRNQMDRLDFEISDKQTRVELFHGIVEAIQNKGEGLEQLSYQNKQKQSVQLLTNAEIIHLQDVANLLDTLKSVVIGAVLLWLVLILFIFFRRLKTPSTKQLLLNSMLILLICSGILLLGPEKIFNQLHIWIFPDNHQWFFYYEDSLMSTMMKAPDLFGYIAAMWVLLSIGLTALLLQLCKKGGGAI